MPEVPEHLNELYEPHKPKKVSKPYRGGPLTVAEFCALPYRERMAYDDAKSAGLTYEQHDDPTTQKPYWKGIPPKKA
ncbi:MAG: hypothetical protein NVS3B25_07290 [Hymenobacter sp.]